MGQQYPDLNGKTREDAWQLLQEWVPSESLQRHCLAVETAMRAYARKYGEPEEAWGMLGLLHDFDYERHPTMEEHTKVGAKVLAEAGYPAWLSEALLVHGFDENYQRASLMDRALFAVDELTGFISAVALVRPSKAVADVKYSSVKKKLKDKSFAAGVHRAELTEGAEELGVPFDEHVTFVIAAMAENADALGLRGVAPDSGEDEKMSDTTQ
ncbi:MAG TPA: HDIG domain-containing protein [Thermomicrobiales bacterium]|nr:HDIG domain-containing protein [Thermomicrobiales bacterium]